MTSRSTPKLSDPSQTPILVVSCDRYADLWDPFFRLFRLRWPDCPFPVVLGTNHLTYEDQSVSTLAIGDDESWASGVRRMLRRLGSSHVILLLEDFLLTQRVDTPLIEELLDVACRKQLGCLRLVGSPPLAYPPEKPVPGYPKLGEISRGSIYRVSAQAAIWRVDTLMHLLVPGATAWEFEEVGTKLSCRLKDDFWGVWDDALHYDQVVEKGRWKPAGIRICQEAGVAIELSTRQAFSPAELDEHYVHSGRNSDQSLARRAVANSFMQGQRLEGLRRTLRAAVRQPLSMRLWATALSGLAGPTFLERLESVWLDRTIAGIERRVRNAGNDHESP